MPPAQCRVSTCWQPDAAPSCDGMTATRAKNGQWRCLTFAGGSEKSTTEEGSTRIYDVGCKDATRQCARKAQRMVQKDEKHEVSKNFHFLNSLRIECCWQIHCAWGLFICVA